MGFSCQFTCRVERVKGLKDKTEFWDRLVYTSIFNKYSVCRVKKMKSGPSPDNRPMLQYHICLVSYVRSNSGYFSEKRFGEYFGAQPRPAELEVSVDNTKPGVAHAPFQILSSHGLTCPKMRPYTKIWACLSLLLILIDPRQAKLSDQRLCADPNCSGELISWVVIPLYRLKVHP